MKDKNYAKIVQTTGVPIKGHKYKIDFLLPYKPEYKKVLKLCGMENEAWSNDESRYLDGFEYMFLNQITQKLDNSQEFTHWETKESEYKPPKEYQEFFKVLELKKYEPTKITIWFYTDEPVNVRELDNVIKDYFCYKFDADYLGLFLNIKKIKELPKEVTRKTLAKIPLTKILNEMLEEKQ